MLKKVLFAILLLGSISILVASASEEKTRAIIVFDGVPSPDNIGSLKKQGANIMYVYNVIPAVALEMPSQALDRLVTMCQNEKNPSTPAICDKITSIEFDSEVYANGKGKNNKPAPSQPLQVLPWGINRVDSELSWSSTTGNGIKIAVIDTGIDYDHPDLDANVKGGVNFVRNARGFKDDNGHGTHVAGTIAAENNGIGVVGVAPDAWLYGVKVLDRKGSGWTSDVIAGIDWSVNNGMQIISMSLGSSSNIQALQDALDNAYARGVVSVAAAGNDNGGAISYPARYSSVIAVTATDSSDNIAYFSNIGPESELAAPGVSVYSTYKDSAYRTLDGTSMATPHVTGAVALLLSSPVPPLYDLDGDSSWDPAEVRMRLQDTSIDLGPPGWDQYFGHGLVNVYNALSS